MKKETVKRWSSYSAFGLFSFAVACGPKAEPGDEPEALSPVTTEASTTFHEPQEGEVHLANIHQLTFGGDNAEAYFSADGTRLVFQHQDSESSSCDQQYVMNIDGSGLHRISNGAGRTTCGFFIEGDTRIMYASSHAHDLACPARPDQSEGYVWPLNHLELYTTNPDGSETRQVTDNGAYNAEATATPDGNRVIFTSTMDGDIELYTMNTDGTDIQRITDRVGYDGGAFFSPDGTKIVWRAQYPESAADSADYQDLLARRMVRPSTLEIWIADADGSNPRQITQLGSAAFAPFFHPDGRRIIFASNHTSEGGRAFELFMTDVDGSEIEQITYSGDFNSFPMFSPDGQKIVFASNRHGASPRETNLFIADWVE